MVFYTLYLVVLLFERHFHFAWHSFATESVYTRGTKSQSCGQCVYKVSHIFISLSGGRGSRWLSLGFPPSIWLSGSKGLKWLSCGFPPSPSQKDDLLVIHIGIPISHWISPRGQWWISWGALSFPRVTSQQRSSMSCQSSSSARFPRFTCNWCGVLPPGCRSLGDNWGPSSLSGVGGWVPEGSPIYHFHVGHHNGWQKEQRS